MFKQITPLSTLSKDNERPKPTITNKLITLVTVQYQVHIRLLNHNVQSLSNKLLDIAVILATDYYNINILCFTEHWLSDAQLQVLNINGFKLVNNFSRSHSASGGSCIFVRNIIETKDVTILGNWEKKEFSKYLQ